MLNGFHQNNENGPDENPGDGPIDFKKEAAVFARDKIGFLASGCLAIFLFFIDHPVLALWCSFVGLMAGLHIPFNYAAIRKQDLIWVVWRKRESAWVIWIWYWALLAAIAVWFSIWAHQILFPEPIPEAHVAISLSVPNDPINNITLTNDFFDSSKPLKTNEIAVVFMRRMEGQPNVSLAISISNDSPRTIMNFQIVATFSSAWRASTDFWWTRSKGGRVRAEIAPHIFVTNNLQVFTIDLPGDIHPGDSIQLPPFMVDQLNNNASMAIHVKYGDFETRTQSLNFNLIFNPPNQFIVLKPFAVNAKLIGPGLANSDLPPDSIMPIANNTNGAAFTSQSGKP
jgi:hypothetical protein